MSHDFVDIASFTFPNDSAILESLFQKEGIEYTLQNSSSNSMIPGVVDIRLLVKKRNAKKAIQIIKEAGFEEYLTPQMEA